MERHESNGNGKPETNGKGKHSMIETRRFTPPQSYMRRPPSPLPWLFLGLAALLGFGLFMQVPHPPDTTTETIPESEAFRWAVNRAMSAAELTQTAQSAAEWQQVTDWWQEAVQMMQMVPQSDPNHAVAVAKVEEYQKNLNYAQGKLPADAPLAGAQPALSSEGVWGVGSRRAEVIRVQGEPTDVDRYDSICKEVLYYTNSEVELNNGIVIRYEDFNRNLKVISNTPILPPTNGAFWTIGSTKEQVFQIQGTPTRLVSYDYSGRETLYYGDSTIDLAKDRVLGYSNINGNLRVRLTPAWDTGSGNTWTLASSREQLLSIQGTPTQVILDQPACTESFRYGDSTVHLKNGFISGYDNLGNNLRVTTGQ